MNKGGDNFSGDGHSHDSNSVCSSVHSNKKSQWKKGSKSKKSSSRRGIGLNFQRFSLRSLFCNYPIGRQFENASSAVLSVNKRKKSSYRDGSSSSDASSNQTSQSKKSIIKGNTVENSYQVVNNVNQSSTESGCTKANIENLESKQSIECPLCLLEQPVEMFPEISTCEHRSCSTCLQQYLSIEISESRVNICCPVCTEAFHPSDLQLLLEGCTDSSNLINKYQDFMVRRVLLNSEPDTRWCPAPDCNYAVIAAGCASCPKLKCESPGCETYFCYHCKQEWHPNQTCDAARAERSPNMFNMYHNNIVRSSSVTFSQGSSVPLRDDIKPCPRCQVLIVKMDDGSCNHISCLICGSEFCWLCMKEISDLHYLSPSGCTFWGKKPWSRKKIILWQLGTLVGAPLGIGLVAGIAIPAMIIGIPVWIGMKIHSQYKLSAKKKRNIAIGGGVAASILVSPIIAGVAVSIGVPVLLAYVYGVVPISLCRSGGCGVSTSPSGGVKIIDFSEDDDQNDQISGLSVSDGHNNLDSVSVSQQSGTHPAHYQSISAGNPSIGESSLQGCSVSASISFGGDSNLERLATISTKDQDIFSEVDRESASTQGLAGSIASSILTNSAGNANAPSRFDLQQSEVNSNKRFSLSSASPSERSNTMSMTNDDACSTKALAGSIVGYRETQSYSAPVEVHVDAPPLDLTIKPETSSATHLKPNCSSVPQHTISEHIATYHSSLVDSSTQTLCLTDVCVDPVITSSSITYPRALSRSKSSVSNSLEEVNNVSSSADVGIQVEITDCDSIVNQNRSNCDRNVYTESPV